MLKFSLPLLLDGGTATNLFKCGMPKNSFSEEWILNNPQKLIDLQKAYVDAGTKVLTAPTFTANRAALKRFGEEEKVAEFNIRLVELTKKAAAGKAAVAGNMSSCGLSAEPFNESTFESLLKIFREQADALKKAGADCIACETFTNLTEARAAVLASKETGLPVTITFTVDESGKLAGDGDVLAALSSCAALGADAVGLNCSCGPESIIKAILGIAKHIPVPIIAKPNTGKPNGSGKFISPEKFASYVPGFLKEGVGLIGGCCGTDPSYIEELSKALKNKKYTPLFGDDDIKKEGVRDFICSNEKQVFFVSEEDMDFSHKIFCGPEMEDKLLELDGANTCARIVINSSEDAREFSLNSYLCTVPVVFLGYDEKSLEEALKLFCGRAMIDTKSDISKEALERLSKKYGAVII